MTPKFDSGESKLNSLLGELASEDLHLTEEELGRLALGLASPAEAESAELHLELCVACRQDLDDLLAIPPAPALMAVSGLIPVPSEPDKKEKRPPVLLWLLAGGSTLAAACLLTYVAINRPWEDRTKVITVVKQGDIPAEKIEELNNRSKRVATEEAKLKSDKAAFAKETIETDRRLAQRETRLQGLQRPTLPKTIIRTVPQTDQASKWLDDGNPASSEVLGSPNKCTIYFNKQVKLFWQADDGQVGDDAWKLNIKIWKVDEHQKLTFFHEYPEDPKFHFRTVDLEYGPNGKDQVYQWEIYSVSAPSQDSSGTAKQEEKLIGRPFRFLLRKGIGN